MADTPQTISRIQIGTTTYDIETTRAATPTAHASTSDEYGVADKNTYGHVKLSNDSSVSELSGTALSIEDAAKNYTPKSHASTEKTYGVADRSTYGHVKLTNEEADTDKSGVAVTPNCVDKKIKEKLNNRTGKMDITWKLDKTSVIKSDGSTSGGIIAAPDLDIAYATFFDLITEVRMYGSIKFTIPKNTDVSAGLYSFKSSPDGISNAHCVVGDFQYLNFPVYNCMNNEKMPNVIRYKVTKKGSVNCFLFYLPSIKKDTENDITFTVKIAGTALFI